MTVKYMTSSIYGPGPSLPPPKVSKLFQTSCNVATMDWNLTKLNLNSQSLGGVLHREMLWAQVTLIDADMGTWKANKSMGKMQENDVQRTKY